MGDLILLTGYFKLLLFFFFRQIFGLSGYVPFTLFIAKMTAEYKAVVLKLQQASESSEELVQTQNAGPHL